MPLYGTLKTMPLPDLLQWLGTSRKTGTLNVEHNKVTKSIQLENGMIVGCSSDDPAGRLGHFLLSRGKITEDQLRVGLEEQAESGKYLGMILVEMGGLSPEELSSHLEEKAEETIFSLFEWEEGAFRFDEELSEQNNVFPIQLGVQDVLLTGLQRFDELRRAQEVFDDTGIILRHTTVTAPPSLDDDRMGRRIYESVNGDRTLAEIVLHVHGSEFMVTTSLFEMYNGGLVEIVGVKRVQPYVRPEQRSAQPQEQPAAPLQAEDEPVPALAADIEADDLLEDPLLAWEPMIDAPVVATAAPVVATPVELPTAAPTIDTVKVEEVREELDRIAEQSVGVEAIEDSEEYRLSTKLEIARELMSTGDFEEALVTLDEVYQQFPGDDSLRRLTAEAEAAFVEKAYKHLLPPQKIPVLVKPMDELETENISPTEFFLLSRMDGTWDIRSIIQIAPIREADALRTLRRMREGGVIELKEPE